VDAGDRAVDPLLERAHESLLTLADGRLGTRGSVLAAHKGDPTVLMSGVYTSAGAETHLLAAPRLEHDRARAPLARRAAPRA
jgi:trehalose/maltose hydrolase-like predicted phosphorylase